MSYLTPTSTQNINNLIGFLTGVINIFDEARKIDTSVEPLNVILTPDTPSAINGRLCTDFLKNKYVTVAIQGNITLNYANTLELINDLKKILNMKKLGISHEYVCKKLTSAQATYLYQLSQVYYVTYIDTRGKITLTLSNFELSEAMPYHISIQQAPQQVQECHYIKYECQNQQVDLRPGTLPDVNQLKYFCKCVDECNCEYLNLPHRYTNAIEISNNGSEFLKLSLNQYKQYVKIHPKYLFKHKYITMNKKREIVVNHILHISENYNGTIYGPVKYYFQLDSTGRMIILPAPQVEKYLILIPEIVENLVDVKFITYIPTSMKNIEAEISEIKQLIAPLDKPLTISFAC